MNFTMHSQGLRFLADMLAGSGRKINGMYVEYGNGGCAAGARDLNYFAGLDKQGTGCGYARVAITNAYVDDTLRVHFDAIVCHGDLVGGAPGTDSAFTCATLIHMPDSNPANDLLVCTIGLAAPVRIVGGASTSVHTSMRLGA